MTLTISYCRMKFTASSSVSITLFASSITYLFLRRLHNVILPGSKGFLFESRPNFSRVELFCALSELSLWKIVDSRYSCPELPMKSCKNDTSIELTAIRPSESPPISPIRSSTPYTCLPCVTI